jgi:hypothetical protein
MAYKCVTKEPTPFSLDGENPLPAVYKKNLLLSDYYLFPAVKESRHIIDLKIM